MRSLVVAGTLGVVALAVPHAAAVVIDFESLSVGATVTNQYSTATFSSIAGQENRVMNGPFAHMICTAAIGGDENCTQPVFVDFTNPVNNLSFVAIEPNEYGTIATVRIYENFIYTADYNITGLATQANTFGYGNQFVSLSAYSNITRIEILGPGGVGDIDNSYSGNGVGWDTFTFEVVPAPATGVLLGLAALSTPRRRRS